MTPKERAAQAAISYIQSNMIVGLGTGSTAEPFIRALGQALADGRVSNIRGIPTSVRSEQLAKDLGIPLTTLGQHSEVDVTVDGADEVTPSLDLIKGMGGALLREKIVAQSTKKLIIVVDSSKRVTRLGEKSPLPVEVTTYAHEAQQRFLRTLGAEPELRMEGGRPYVTDNGNYIYNCRFRNAIPDPVGLNETLCRRAGVVESGLFLGMASVALVADDESVTTLKR